MTKDVFFVIRSLLEDPVSLLDARARVVGAVGAVVSGVAKIAVVRSEVSVVNAVRAAAGARGVTVLDPTTIDLTYLSASFDVSVYVELVADPMVEHEVKSVADVQLCQEYANDILIGAATKETVEVRVEPTAVTPLGAVLVATIGVIDLNGASQYS